MKFTKYVLLGIAFLSFACAEEKRSDDACIDPTLSGPHIRNTRQMILRDEGNELLHRVNLNAPATNWTVEIPRGRDLQLVGSNRVMIGTEDGYQEHNLTNGVMVAEVSNHPGTISARRLRNGNTLLAISQNLSGFSLVEVNAAGAAVHTITHTERSYIRLVRETSQGTYLVTSNATILELDETGTVLWEATVNTDDPPHAWQAVRLATGETIVSCGYAANMQLFSADGQYLESIQGPLSTTPSFYSGFQIMNDGNYVIANWQGHGAGNGNKGVQVVELNPAGELVWSWKQDPAQFSSIQGLIVLDGLDLKKTHVEGCTGALVPVD